MGEEPHSSQASRAGGDARALPVPSSPGTRVPRHRRCPALLGDGSRLSCCRTRCMWQGCRYCFPWARCSAASLTSRYTVRAPTRGTRCLQPCSPLASLVSPRMKSRWHSGAVWAFFFWTGLSPRQGQTPAQGSGCSESCWGLAGFFLVKSYFR